MTLTELLLGAAERDDRGLTFYATGERVSYARLLDRARRRAAGLRRLGSGHRVALLAGTTPDMVTSLLGVWLAGAVPVCLPPPPRMGRRDNYLRDLGRRLGCCGATTLVAPGAVLRSVALPHGVAPLAAEALDGPPTRVDLPERRSPGLVQFSSGTTRDPAPIGISQGALADNLQAILSRFPGRPEDHSCVSWLPLYHDMGLVGCLLCSLAAQADLTLLSPHEFVLRPANWLRALQGSRATTSVAPNFALSLCVERSRGERFDLSDWRYVLVGAEQVLPSTLERFCETFSCCGFDERALTPVYGLGEATLAVTMSELAAPPRMLQVDPGGLSAGLVRPGSRRLVSLGGPLPGLELKIEGGQVGRVHLRGSSVMDGYLGQPERTARCLKKGWLDTGDLGFLHHGELYLCGRSRDLLILQGRNHDPGAVEESLDPLDGLGAVAAFAVSDSRRGTESLVLVAELARGCAGQAAGIAGRAREAVVAATGLVPSQVHLCPAGSLARTSSGKIRRSQVRQDLESGALVPLGSF